jgi:glycosyltransferase involved in cell wall biosynthesis
MIVKNESARITRCLDSVVPHIAAWAILDTWSTDNTREIIRDYFADRKIPGRLMQVPFEDFSASRNKALDLAEQLFEPFDYFLLVDADMELRIDDPNWSANLTAAGYCMVQRGSGITYRNTRLVKRGIGARYHGATHEYINVPGDLLDLYGAWFIDHMDGANRPGKLARDFALLDEAFRRDPTDTRTAFYLAQTLRDLGRKTEAASLYGKRAAMRGWDEEAYYAHLQQARALRDVGSEREFVYEAIAAFNRRPTRAESLYDLAKYYREHSMQAAGAMIAERCLEIQRPPSDILFIEDHVYDYGIREEFAICANYADPERKDRGHAVCLGLALDHSVPSGTRDLARSNLYHYFQPIGEMLPSWKTRRLKFEPPEGYHQMSPSVARFGDRIMVAERTINYWITEQGYQTPGSGPVHTRTFLLELDPISWEETTHGEILMPEDLPPPAWDGVQGFEDSRLFEWRNDLWTVSTVREQNHGGMAEQWLARIDGTLHMTEARALYPEGPRRHEKNWIPLVESDELKFIYLCDPTRIVGDDGRTLVEHAPVFACEHFRGGSQAIPFDGGWLAVVHTVTWQSGWPKYRHNFIWLDAEYRLKKVSLGWVFPSSAMPDLLRGYQYVIGLCWHPDGKRLIMGYQLDERESWIGVFDAGDASKLLLDFEDVFGHAPPSQPRQHAESQTANIAQPAPDPVVSTSETIFPIEINRDDLAALFTHYGSDKTANGYAELYEMLFRDQRHGITRVLEIGIGTMIPGAASSMVGYAGPGYRPGGSLRAWRDYFPNATVYGADTQPDTQIYNEDRIITLLCDSTNRYQVDSLVRPMELFDVIIDDGSHRLDDQKRTLENFFPLLKPGGIYIVEDIIPGGLYHHQDFIRSVVGDAVLHFAGTENNPLVITKMLWVL